MKKVISVVLALVLVSVLSVSAFAAGSVVAPVEKEYDGGKVTYQPTPDNNKEYTFVASPKDGYDFVGWDIEGEYEIVSGSEDDPIITVVLKDGTTPDSVTASFRPIEDDEDSDDEAADDEAADDEAEEDDEKEPGKGTSPKTGKSVAMLALAVVACGGLMVSKKRLAK